MRKTSENRWLAFVLTLFVLVGVTYALVTPVFEASDELWHYPLVRHLAAGKPLPVQVFDPAQAGPWNQEASQPPLYYYLAAALTFWIDASDMEEIRWLNPHVDNGLITADGNNNLVIHDPARNPWRGTLLAVRVARLASVLLGMATVYLTYRIAKEVAPNRPEIALGAAAANAFIPMFLFISGAVNNDNLVTPLASLAVWLMIRQAVEVRVDEWQPGYPLSLPPHFSVHLTSYRLRWLALGTVIGLAALTKISGMGLLPLALGTILVVEWERQGRLADRRALVPFIQETVVCVLLIVGPVLLIAGWWYARNIQLYGDWTGWNAFIAVLGQRAHPASLAQLWDERWGFMLSYWGLFGGVNVPMAAWIYRVLNGVVLIAVIGFVVYLWKEVIGFKFLERGRLPIPLRQAIAANLWSFTISHFPLFICLLWSAAVVLGLVRWATTTWSSQGRLVFTAISTLSTLLVVGLAGWLPRRPAAWVVAALAVFLFLVAAVAPFLWIRPAYQVKNEPLPPELQEVNVNFSNQMRLVGYQIEPARPHPGEEVVVTLVWETLAVMERDWSVFVHLTDTVLETPVVQRDMYLAHGLRPTRLLALGERLVNHYWLRIPSTTTAPAELALVVGLYDFYSGERLPLANSGNAATLTTVPLEAPAGDVPNPLSVNFENELELVGYQLTERLIQPGDTVELVLYWRSLRPTTDHTFFAQIVDEDTTRWASADLAPLPGTSGWTTSSVQRLTLTMNIAADTPPGVYPLIIGLYTRTAAGGFDRLQTLTPEGHLSDDFLKLTPVRVLIP